MHPHLFNLGPIPIYTYGFFVFLGVLFSYFIAIKEANRVKIETKVFSDIFFWSLLSAFAGARLLYILVNLNHLFTDPWDIIFSRSGFVFYGGIISGGVAIYYLAKYYKIKFLKLADIFSMVIPLGHSLGRIGCFYYGCCYGRPTDSWLGMKFPANCPAGSLGVKVIPTQLIEALFLLLIFAILFILQRRKHFLGQIFIAYLILYGSFRFIIEFFRFDPRGQFLNLSTSQYIALLAIILGLILYLKIKK